MNSNPLLALTLLAVISPFVLIGLIFFVNRQRKTIEQQKEIIARRVVSGILIVLLLITIAFHLLTHGMLFVWFVTLFTQ